MEQSTNSNNDLQDAVFKSIINYCHANLIGPHNIDNSTIPMAIRRNYELKKDDIAKISKSVLAPSLFNVNRKTMSFCTPARRSIIALSILGITAAADGEEITKQNFIDGYLPEKPGKLSIKHDFDFTAGSLSLCLKVVSNINNTRRNAYAAPALKEINRIAKTLNSDIATEDITFEVAKVIVGRKTKGRRAFMKPIVMSTTTDFDFILTIIVRDDGRPYHALYPTGLEGDESIVNRYDSKYVIDAKVFCHLKRCNHPDKLRDLAVTKEMDQIAFIQKGILQAKNQNKPKPDETQQTKIFLETVTKPFMVITDSSITDNEHKAGCKRLLRRYGLQVTSNLISKEDFRTASADLLKIEGGRIMKKVNPRLDTKKVPDAVLLEKGSKAFTEKFDF